MSKNILFLVSGSIAAYKSCEVISGLLKLGHKVKVVATASALEFVGKATFEGLTGEQVSTEIFTDGKMMAHIALERWSDLIVLCPATANTLNKFSAGISDDLLGNIFLAHEFSKPFLIFPAMNSAMWNHPATKNSIGQLRSWGIKIYSPDSGALACGETGVGRLIEPSRIIRTVNEHVMPEIKKRYNVLITGGGMSEPIDAVRAITNSSTGKTASSIASALDHRGFMVDYLAQAGSALPLHSQSISTFRTFNDLQTALGEKLKNKTYDAIVHCAAVADYSLKSVDGKQLEVEHKASSDQETMSLILERNPKLLSMISGLIDSNRTTLVAFKLTSGKTAKEAYVDIQKIFDHSTAHFVVHNDSSQIQNGLHSFKIYKRNFIEPVAQGETKSELAVSLSEQIEHHLVSIEHQEEWL